MEVLIIAVLGFVLLIAALAVPILALVAFLRTQQLDSFRRRIERLEAALAHFERQQAAPHVASTSPLPLAAPAAAAPDTSDDIVTATIFDTPTPPPSSTTTNAPPTPRPYPTPYSSTSPFPSPFPTTSPADSANFSWELFLGRKALGWAAVVVLLFATGFFLKYAFDNAWIGPLGQASLGVFGGLALLVAGWRQHRRAAPLASQMLTGAGIVLLYLSTFATFGFYHLLPQSSASIFLILLVAQAALLALLYDSFAIALASLLGGLLTPLLLASDHDQYISLFLYLAILAGGIQALTLRKAWPVLGTLALLGVQGIYWGWYFGNYHPEKFIAAASFQALLFVAFGGQGLLSATARLPRSTWEESIRMSLNAGLAFLAAHELVSYDYADWTGTLAVAFAGLYALAARFIIASPNFSRPMLLVVVGIAASFVAITLPLQAATTWVALAWAVQAAVLWWMGIRVSQRPLLVMSTFLALATMLRLAVHDIPQLSGMWSDRHEFWPVFNLQAAPSLAAIAALMASLVVAKRQLVRRLAPPPNVTPANVTPANSVGSNAVGSPLWGAQVATASGFVACLLLIWYLVSVDVFASFATRDYSDPNFDSRWSMAGMWVSTWWAAYAMSLLAIGLFARARLLRWTALGIFACTLFKIFFVDLAGLDQIYRIIAFFVLAIFLGIAAWAYQRFSGPRPPQSQESNHA